MKPALEATENIQIQKNYLKGDSSLLIDFIRVIACEMVVVCHVFLIYNIYFDMPVNNTNIFYILDVTLGNTGVVLFFIVSGIVISHSLFKKAAVDSSYGFMNYFIDRFSRIYTGLIPFLIFLFFCNIILLGMDPDYFHKIDLGLGTEAITYFGNLLMLQNFVFPDIKTPAYGGILWTLNIEWWLYLLFGWISINLIRGKKFDLYFLVPLLLFAYFPLLKLLLDSSRDTLIVVWFMGVAATLLYVNTKIKWDRRFNYAIFALAFLVIARIGMIIRHSGTIFDLTLETLLVFLVVLLMLKYKGMNRFENTRVKGIIKFMSKYSFTLYLVHFVIENLIFCLYLTSGLNFPLILVFAFAIIMSNIAAIIIAYPTEMRYKHIAKYLNGLRTRITGARITSGSHS